MPGIDGGLSQDLRGTLNSLAIDLYWSDLDYYEAREVVSDRLTELGFEIVGVSENRIVIDIPEDRLPDHDERLVAKLPQRKRGGGGVRQNIEETDLYLNGPDWLREYLIPIEAAHRRGYWLLEPYAPEPGEDEIEKRKRVLLDRGIGTMEIKSAQNWGRWQGEVFLIDYGLHVSDCLPDVDVRDWTEIVNEEDRRHGLISDETTEEDDEEEEQTPESPLAERVVVLTDVIPGLKSNVREKLRGEVVESGDEVEINLDDRRITVEVERTEPRSDRYMQDYELLIGEETRISL